MALAHILVIPGVSQIVVAILLRQGLLSLQDSYYLLQLSGITPPLDYGMEQDGDPVPPPSNTPVVDPETADGFLVCPVTRFSH